MKKHILTVSRKILAFVVVIVIGLLMLFGTAVLTVNEMFNRGTIEKAVWATDLGKWYGKDAVKAINVGIKHLTDSAYTDSLYLTDDTLMQCVDERQIKTFLTDTLTVFAKAMMHKATVSVRIKDMIPLFEGVRAHVYEQLGIEITDKQMENELSNAFGGIELHFRGGVEIFSVPSGWAIGALIAAGVLLLLEILIVYPDLLTWAIACLTAFILAFILLMICGVIVKGLIQTDLISSVLGEGLVQSWLSILPKLLQRNAFLLMIGSLVPIIVGVIAMIDGAHIRSIKQED